MSVSLSTSLDFIAKQCSIYIGIPILIGGVLGNFLNIIVFLSLRTFRQNSSVFYLTIMSVVNISQLITGLFARIMITGFGIDWTLTSLFFCKFRYFLFPASSLISFSCISMATIDQYLATCSRPRWQKLCNINLAHYLSVFFVVFWLLHGIPYLFIFEQVTSLDTHKVMCVPMDSIFNNYRIYGVSLILTGFFPVIITTIFGMLAYHNVRMISYRTIPLVRRELDKQLTVMVLTQCVVNFFTVLPFSIMVAVLLNPSFMSERNTIVILLFITTLTTLMNYVYFASPFFIYFSAAERFRRQTIHVLFKIHSHHRQQRNITNNQIKPIDQPTEY